jgi:hypothetical protein
VGRLEGLLLTGLTDDGLAVLASYVDRTGDVQTVSLLATVAMGLVSQGQAGSAPLRTVQSDPRLTGWYVRSCNIP